jgi:hypothetical protein
MNHFFHENLPAFVRSLNFTRTEVKDFKSDFIEEHVDGDQSTVPFSMNNSLPLSEA